MDDKNRHSGRPTSAQVSASYLGASPEELSGIQATGPKDWKNSVATTVSIFQGYAPQEIHLIVRAATRIEITL